MRLKQKQSLQGFMLFKDVSGIGSEKCQVYEFVEGWNWKPHSSHLQTGHLNANHILNLNLKHILNLFHAQYFSYLHIWLGG